MRREPRDSALCAMRNTQLDTNAAVVNNSTSRRCLRAKRRNLWLKGVMRVKVVCALDNGDVDATHDYHMSINAMTGLHYYRTMRIIGNVRDKPVHILIHMVSTHNLLDLETAKRLGCKLDSMEPFPMAVANENKMYSSFTCDINWNFHQLKMEFMSEEPKALPPRREHDHSITLKPDTSPINLRPYGYPHAAKK
ncbi:UNVERIFIED_CONTAM: hypothetical protein Scaly_2434800 [Sesamum calycinum]|uniref:Uncharacterized protein n=1 Tax=Sesamum calycinum TaxID=2727403 RepID=A0AAW2LZD5_9LAMI